VKAELLHPLEKDQIMKKFRIWLIVVAVVNLVLLPDKPDIYLTPIAGYLLLASGWLVFINPVYKHQYTPTLFIIRNLGLLWATFGFVHNMNF
jgi:hypothetical protein